MKTNFTLLLGMAMGAGLMYLLDPDRGRHRQAMVRDQMAHLANKGQDELESKSRHVANVARGTAHEAAKAVKQQTDTAQGQMTNTTQQSSGTMPYGNNL